MRVEVDAVISVSLFLQGACLFDASSYLFGGLPAPLVGEMLQIEARRLQMYVYPIKEWAGYLGEVMLYLERRAVTFSLWVREIPARTRMWQQS